jgi:PAS domain S-box-containing protein
MSEKKLHPAVRQIVLILLAAAAYYAFASLQQAIAGSNQIYPINVNLWLPAGLALGVVMVLGPWMAVGVFLGSFLFHLTILSGPHVVLASASFGLGFALQSLAGDWLFRTLVKRPSPLNVREALWAMVVALVTAVVSPAISVTGICAVGFEAWKAFGAIAWHWWMGSVCGILIVTPSVVLLGLRAKGKPHKEPLLWVLSSLLLGIGFLAFTVVDEIDIRNLDAIFARDAHEMTQVVNHTIGHDIQALNALGYYYSAVGGVEPHEFEALIKKLVVNDNDARAFLWVPRVEGPALGRYESTYASKAGSIFHVYERNREGQSVRVQRDKAAYFPIDLMYPSALVEGGPGIDLGSSPECSLAINKAMEEGKTTATPPIWFPGAEGLDSSVLVFSPVYRGGSLPETTQERRAAFSGCVVGWYDPANWVRNAMFTVRPRDIDMFLFDVQDGHSQRFVAFLPSSSGRKDYSRQEIPTLSGVQDKASRVETMDVADRSWLVVTRFGFEYLSFENRWLALGSLVLAFAITGVFLGFFDRRQRTETVVLRSEAEFRALSDNALTGVLRIKPSGEILYANEAVAHIFSFDSAKEFKEADIRAKVAENEQVNLMLRRLETVGQVNNYELDIADNLGQTRSLLCSATVFEGVVNATIADITERRKMELDIRERVKELTCLFEITTLLGGYESPETQLFEDVTGELEKAMQFPELAVVGVELDASHYGHAGDGEIPEKNLASPIEIAGRIRGRVVVFYSQDKPFIIPEEQALINNVARMLGMWLENKEVETALRRSNERFEMLAGTIQEAFWIYDLAGNKMEYMSKAYETIWGKPRGKLYETPSEFMDSLLPEDRPILRAAQERNYHNESTDIEYRIRSADGTIRQIWDRSFPVLDAKGRVVRRTGVCSDITELKKTQAAIEELNRELERRVEERTGELREHEALYRGLFENSNDAIFLLSPEGKGIQANQKGLDMIGYSASEFLAMSPDEITALVPRGQQPGDEKYFSRALRGEEVPLYERVFAGKGGKRTDAEFNLSVVRDGEGKTVVVQNVVRDISERKRVEEKLRESRDKLSAANAALEKASRLKDEFLASMSHELRTPLTGILGLAEALQLQTFGILNEKQTKALQNMETSGHHLLDLINDILDLSKIEAGKFDLQMENCDVVELCQASLQLTKGMAHQKRQNIGFSIDPVSIIINVDKRRLKQMLVNLLSNAIKFTPEGGNLGLEVKGSVRESTVEFCVWDKGIGIGKENLGRLFMPFSQLDASLSRQYSGTGLGLSLVRHMAELHGGSVKVESGLGQGSRFTIVLPWLHSETAVVDAGRRIGAGSLKSALVIEDNPIDVERLTRYLDQLGISTIHLPILDKAVEKAAAFKPSAILLDLNLPDGSGMDTLEELKADERTKNIPVIIVSVEDLVGEAKKRGALGYLFKPFSFEDLQTELERAAVFASHSSPVLIFEEKYKTAPIVLMADDDELVLETVSNFLKSRGYAVVSAKSGVELLSSSSSSSLTSSSSTSRCRGWTA